ncbi:MAG: KilA-N domain-containing protein [Candidatus Moranbacteria bacterium]|nr:KilA-N domain-containing protein [Candidatus Moranbacteria bacterium]
MGEWEKVEAPAATEKISILSIDPSTNESEAPLVTIISERDDDFISLTDMAKSKNAEFPADVIKNWLKTRFTIDFMGLWEKVNNVNFKPIEFDGLRKGAGLNSFSLTPRRWIETVGAVGIVNKAGRYGGGTFAHKDIAFEFAMWISPEFRLYLIKEFQRLKADENEKLILGWDARRMLTKINYKIHTDAIKENIVVPSKLSNKEANIVYANEADVLNVALLGMTAKEWKSKNKNKDGNLRDYADVTQLVCLANLENLNAEYIRVGLPQKERLLKLNESAISQMKSLVGNASIKKLENKK